MSFYKTLIYNSNKENYFILRPVYNVKYIKENLSLVPRFNLKDPDVFNDFPANEELKYSTNLIKKAIEYGMILHVDYKGEDDKNFSGHDRYVYPMVLGTNKEGKELLRVYHLKGQSVSSGGNVEKEQRLFRTDRILSMKFSGAFYRLPPNGYNETGDKSMSKIIAQADFNSIRNLQQSLLDNNKIDTLDRTILKKVNNVYVKDLNYDLDITKPFDGNVLPKKDAKNIRLTFAKPLIGNDLPVCIIGISIEPNVMFNFIKNDYSRVRYKSIKQLMVDDLKSINNIDNKKIFNTFLYLKSN